MYSTVPERTVLHTSIDLSILLTTYLFLSINLSIYLFVYVSLCLHRGIDGLIGLTDIAENSWVMMDIMDFA